MQATFMDARIAWKSQAAAADRDRWLSVQLIGSGGGGGGGVEGGGGGGRRFTSSLRYRTLKEHGIEQAKT